MGASTVLTSKKCDRMGLAALRSKEMEASPGEPTAKLPRSQTYRSWEKRSRAGHVCPRAEGVRTGLVGSERP